MNFRFCKLVWPVFSLAVLLAIARSPLFAQACPAQDDKSLEAETPSSLRGVVVFHDVTRAWIGLGLEQPVCGTREIELVFSRSKSWKDVKRMRGCRVTVSGKIGEGPTVYYATDLNFFDPQVKPDDSCKMQPAEPDFSKVSIPSSVEFYRATVFINVQHQLPLRGQVMLGDSKGIAEVPWRAYALPSLNGEEDLDLSCHDGFTLVSFKSVPRGSSMLMDPGVARLESAELAASSLTIFCRRR